MSWNSWDPLASGGMSMLQWGSVNIYTWWLSSWLLSALIVPVALLANGDLAFKGHSTNCSVGLNFWSENLLSAGDITGEAFLLPLLLPSHADRAALGCQKERGAGKTDPICPKQMMWLLVAWVALVLPCRAASAPVLFLQAALGARQATASAERQWLTRATDLLLAKPFLSGRVNPLPDGLLQESQSPSQREEMTAQSSSSRAKTGEETFGWGAGSFLGAFGSWGGVCVPVVQPHGKAT